MTTSGDQSGDDQPHPSAANTAEITLRDGVMTIGVPEEQHLRTTQLLISCGVPYELSSEHFLNDECDAVHALAALATAGIRFVWAASQRGDHQPAALFGFTVRSPNL